MNRQDKRQYKKQAARKRMLLLLATALMITIGSVLFGNAFTSAQAHDTEQTYKYYKSIVIEKGDTLWDIAKEYKTEAYESTKEYVQELIQLNGLSSDLIHEGQSLVVIYYDTEFK